jgi:hypothetical protein
MTNFPASGFSRFASLSDATELRDVIAASRAAIMSAAIFSLFLNLHAASL